IKETLHSTASIFFVAVGAILLTRFLLLAGIPRYLAGLMGDWALDPLWLVIGSSLMFVVLGMFLDAIGLMLLALPILLPMYEELGLNLIWMGVLVIKYLEIGMITPPVGLNAYVVKGVVGDTVALPTIFKGLVWFMVAEAFIVGLLIAFPEISLYLPSLME
ncbi:MAG TPA: C4-dicarboxylate ABC transporter, partial [Gammaproteobacteria bacterium]|nr:C4-dicarboxylate ABC transporter [Gammaproteobacteria bacterium]